MTGQVTDVVAMEPQDLVRVCLRGLEVPCVMSDADGNFSLARVPDDQDLLVEMRKDGFVTGLRMLHTDRGSVIDLGASLLPRVDEIAAQRELLGLPPVEGTGLVGFVTLDTSGLPVVESRAFLSPADASPPYFFNLDRMIDPSLTSAAEASGYFYNVPTTEHAIALSVQGGAGPKACNLELPGLGWGPDEAGVGHRVTVVADMITLMVGVCDATDPAL